MISSSFLVLFSLFIAASQQQRANNIQDDNEITSYEAPRNPEKKLPQQPILVEYNSTQANAFSAASEYLFETMDFNVPPCENFYKFVCGNIEEAEVANQVTEANWNDIYAKMAALREDMHNEPAAIRTAVNATFNIVFQNETEEMKENFTRRVMREFLEVTGLSARIFDDNDEQAEPTRQQLGKALGYLASRSLFPLLKVDVSRFISPSRDKPPLIVQIESGNLFNNSEFRHIAVPHFSKLMKQFRQINGKNNSLFFKDMEIANELFDLEVELFFYKKNLPVNITIFDNADTLTLDGLNRDFGQNFEWTEMLKETMRNVDNSTLRDRILRNPIQLNEMHFFRQLNRKINTTRLAQFLTVRLLNDISYMYFTALPGATIPPGLDLVFARIYTDARFSNENEQKLLKRKIMAITENILQGWTEMLTSATWLSQLSKEKFLLKIGSMAKNVLSPDEIMDDRFLNDYYAKLNVTAEDGFIGTMEKLRNFEMLRKLENLFQFTNYSLVSYFERNGVITNNAWHVPMYNSITVPLGEIRPPIFHSDWPASHAYGGLGFINGHEIGHGFDNKGIIFGAIGQKENQLDDEQSRRVFNEHCDCLSEEYSTMCTAMPNASLACLDGRKALDENMADHSGIRAAYRAFHRHVHMNGPEPRLPHQQLGQFKHDQLFFMFLTRFWCVKDAPHPEEAGGYSPHAQRILGTLRHFPAFAEAFNCQPADPMVSRNNCDLWDRRPSIE